MTHTIPVCPSSTDTETQGNDLFARFKVDCVSKDNDEREDEEKKGKLSAQ